MRLAISNIAWDRSEDEAVAALLKRHQIDAIDIAPGKYFAQPAKATISEIRRIKDWWAQHGIEITGMQALLFGTKGLNAFGSSESQDKMLQHLNAVCQIGAGLNASRLVFGSPRNRDRSGLNDSEALSMAVSFFRRVGDVAAFHGVVICLEPNPICYGANFMTTSLETSQVVRHIAHPSVRMQFDTGALTVNGEDPATVLQESAGLIGHIHASEPNLLPLGDGDSDHASMFRALMRCAPHQLVTVEMVATQNESHLVSIDRALRVATQHYRPNAFKATA